MDVSALLSCLDDKKSWAPTSFVLPLYESPSSVSPVDVDLMTFMNPNPSNKDKMGLGVKAVCFIVCFVCVQIVIL